MSTIRVLVVDDHEHKALEYAHAVLRRVDGIGSPIQVEVAIALTPFEARDRLHDARRRQNDFDILITDFHMPEEDGLDLIRSLPELGFRPDSLDVVLVSQKTDALPSMDVIDDAAITWGGSKESVRRVLLEGKDIDALHETITAIIAARLEERRSLYYRITIPAPDVTTGSFVTVDPNLLARLDDLYTRMAPSELSILLQGETGTGKERLADEIHARSRRRQKPLVKFDMPALSDTLIDSQLFGAKKGSFTSATRDIRGLFERADGGTAYLSEIGYVSREHQRKLLNVLEDHVYYKIGGERQKVDFRLISATNVNLKQAVADDTFQEDLYYRLAEYKFEIPPLRERSCDIPYLANWFWKRSGNASDVARTEPLSADVLLYLQSSKWPGNVRALENYIRTMKVIVPVGQEPSVNDLKARIPVDSQSYCTGLSILNGFGARRQHMLFYPIALSIGETSNKAHFNRQLFERAFTQDGLAFGNTFDSAMKSIDNAWENHRKNCVTCQELWTRRWPAGS